MNYDQLRRYAAIMISTLCGVLISLPLAIRSGGTASIVLPLIGGAIGILIGRRRGSSVSYFYLVLMLTAFLIYIVANDLSQFRV